MKRKIKLLVIFAVFTKGVAVVASDISQDEKCYEINKLEIQGAYELSKRELNKLKKRHENKCLTVLDIKNLIKTITNIYIGNGYITTRAYILKQNLTEKKLVIKVQEGLLEDIEHINEKTIANDVLPLAKGRILSLRDIEQGIDNVNRSNNINIYLKPGSKEGGSIAVIDSKPSKKWHISSGIDNLGSKNKGRNQSFTNFSFENLFSFNEYYLFGYRTAIGNHNRSFMNSYNMVISIPYKYNSFMLQYNNARYKTLIQTPKNKYINHGGSKVTKLNIDRVIHRDGNSKTNISVGKIWDDYSNYIADNKIETSTYRISKFDIGIRYQRRLNASSLALGANVVTGENQNYRKNFGNIKVPAKSFYKCNYNFSWYKPLGVIAGQHSFKYNLQVNGQYSPVMLVATEKDTVGGLSSVRGFQDYSENADNTAVIRNELIIELPALGSRLGKLLFNNVGIFGAFDLGKFSNYEENGTRSGIMSGIAAGIRNTNKYINFSAVIALPLETPVAIKRKSVVYFSLALDL